MKPNSRLTWLTLVLLLAMIMPYSAVNAAAPRASTASVASPVSGAIQTDLVPRFEAGPCTFTIPTGVIEGTDVRCGTLIVPELYANPSGPTLALAVAIISAASANPRPDPVVFAQGGPGGSTIDYYTQVLFSSRIRKNRELVLFDQRGTKYSKPNLFCQEIYDETIDTLPLDLKTAESEKRSYAAAMACRERMVKEGINLAAFNSVENANDIESLRTTLGYKQINLYGVSYGTLLALHAMRQNPAGLRSVIIDSVVPPTINFNFEAPRSGDRAFTELFKACAADAGCSKDYPNLEKFFFDLVERLNQKPVTMHLLDSETGKTHDALINGDGLIGILFQMLYATELIPLMPKMIHAVADGNYAFLEGILPLFIFDKTVSYGMYYSVVCAEGGTSDPSQLNFENIRPELAKDADISNQGLVKLCTDWKVPALPAADEAAVQSSIPTLVFNGRFDPITPPAYGQEAAKTLSKSYYFVFPNTGHGALTTSDCADGIFLEFLSNPDHAPDASCIDTLPPVQFLTRKEVLDVPAAYQVMMELNDALGKGKLPKMQLLFGVWLLVLLSAGVIFPGAWLVRVLRRKPAREIPLVVHLASWIPVMNSGVVLAFALGFVVVLFQAAINGSNSYFFGIPAANWPLLLLPWMSLGLTVLTLGYAAAGWLGHYWSVLRKVYYSLLALASLASVVMLGMGGLLTALLR
jgi:pimeloyl-ACP methyl ester carboxylesterase